MKIHVRWLAAIAVVSSLLVGSAAAQETGDSFRQKALELNNVTGENARRDKLRELYKDKVALRKLLAEAVAMAKDKPKEPPFNYNANQILATASWLIKDHQNSEFFYRACLEQAYALKSNQKKRETLEGLLSCFYTAKRYEDAFLTCQKMLELKGEDNIELMKPFVMARMAEIRSKQGKHDEALKIIEPLLKFDGDEDYRFHQKKAEIVRESGKSEEALKLYEEIIKRLEKLNDDEYKERGLMLCKYIMSGIHVDLKQLDKGIELLEGLLKDKPDNSTFNNDLGYLLADNDRRLDDAEKMIRKALELDKTERKKQADEGEISDEDDKENSAYQDSLAWVLYKKKKYDEAKTIMLEVIKSEDAQHVEIYDHLAEVYLALGDKDNAIKAWKKGLTMENVSPRDEARKAAVKKKLETHGK